MESLERVIAALDEWKPSIEGVDDDIKSQPHLQAFSLLR
jgi:hypothetical protein